MREDPRMALSEAIGYLEGQAFKIDQRRAPQMVAVLEGTRHPAEPRARDRRETHETQEGNMNNDRLTEGHEHDHTTEEEAVACAIQAITNGIGHGVHSAYPEAENDPAVALGVAAALLSLAAKYAVYAGHHPITWLKQQVDVNEKYAQAKNSINN